MSSVLEVAVSEVVIPAYNPRKSLDATTVAELAESMRERGLLQPIMVRLRPNEAGFELVFGQRRLAAARLLGWEKINALVMRAGDAEAQQAAVVENLQREQLPPLEEAEAIAGLLKGGMAEAEVAARIGMRLPTLRARMKLLTLHPDARAALRDRHITLASAAELSRLESQEAQAAVIKEALKFYGGNGTISPHAVTSLVERRTSLLERARFPILDDALLLSAPACTACPKRSSAQASLFGAGAQTDADDRCMDQACWDAKTQAHDRAQVQAWERLGGKLVKDEAKARKLAYSSHHVALHVPVPNWARAHKLVKADGATWLDIIPADALAGMDLVILPALPDGPKLLALVVDVDRALGLDVANEPEEDHGEDDEDPESAARHAAWQEKREKERAEREAETAAKSLAPRLPSDPKLVVEMGVDHVADLLRVDTEMDLLSLRAAQEPESDELIRGVLGVMVGLVSPHGEPNVFQLARRWCTDAAVQNIKSREAALTALRRAVKVMQRAQLHGALVEALYALDDQAALPLGQLFGVTEKDVAKAAAALAKTAVEDDKKALAAATEGEPKKKPRKKKAAA